MNLGAQLLNGKAVTMPVTEPTLPAGMVHVVYVVGEKPRWSMEPEPMPEGEALVFIPGHRVVARVEREGDLCRVQVTGRY